MILAHKIRLDPTIRQEQALWKAVGCSRYAYNWALERWEAHYKATGKNPNIYELKKLWNKEKPQWVYESPKDANQAVFSDADRGTNTSSCAGVGRAITNRVMLWAVSPTNVRGGTISSIKGSLTAE